MKRIGKFFYIAALLTAGMLTACSVDDADNDVASYDGMDNSNLVDAVYDGAWTVNKQEVDTARLEVTNVLKLRLPERYLGLYCFENENFSSLRPVTIEYKGQPVVIPFRSQGYTSDATFNSITSTEKQFNGTVFFNNAFFYVVIDGVDHRVDLLSNEPGNAVYRNDNGQWTLGLTITAFNVTNMETHEEEVRTPQQPIILYYNTKNRIR